MVTSRRYALLVGSLAFAITALYAASLTFLAGNPADATWFDTGVWAVTSAALLGLSASPSARARAAAAAETRPVRVAFALIALGSLALAVLLTADAVGRVRSLSGGDIVGYGFWIAVFGLFGTSGLASLAHRYSAARG